MRYLGLAVLALTAPLAVSPPLAAQNPAVFTASSAWALDYGDDYCRLMRDFERGSDTIGLFIERTQPGPMMRLIVVGDAVRLYRGAQEIGYRLHPSGTVRTAPRLVHRTTEGQQYLNLGPVMLAEMASPAPGGAPAMPPPYNRQAEAELAGKITGIALERGVTSPVIVETGSLGEAIGALQACADDLLASWGLDAEKHKNLSRPAMPAQPTAGWIARDTIPFGDFAKLSGGNNEIRVQIDKSGKATSCHIQWPALDRAINDKICASVMQNSSFMPALDQEGQPLDSFWTANVFFLMPPFGP